MRYLNSDEFPQFYDSFLEMCRKHAIVSGQETWGYPGGMNTCDTYSFRTRRGTMHIGHDANIVENRWWIPVGLEAQRNINDLDIAYEVNIPREHNLRLSVHFMIDDANLIHILHKGKVTARHSLSMEQFFNYYRSHPSRWPVIRVSFYDYLELGTASLPIADGEFLELLESFAEFAEYIPTFKANYR